MPTDSFLTPNYNHVLIALGANLGGQKDSPLAQLQTAVDRISKSGLEVTSVSRFWRTPAYPPGSGPDFVNAALCARSALEPEQILDRLHSIERDAGRDRNQSQRWGARVLDLDLLAVGDIVLPDAATVAHWISLPAVAQQQLAPRELVLPHPRLQDRGFVLAPLVEIAADWEHPVLRQTVAQLHAALPDDALTGMSPIPHEFHTQKRV